MPAVAPALRYHINTAVGSRGLLTAAALVPWPRGACHVRHGGVHLNRGSGSADRPPPADRPGPDRPTRACARGRTRGKGAPMGGANGPPRAWPTASKLQFRIRMAQVGSWVGVRVVSTIRNLVQSCDNDAERGKRRRGFATNDSSRAPPRAVSARSFHHAHSSRLNRSFLSRDSPAAFARSLMSLRLNAP